MMDLSSRLLEASNAAAASDISGVGREERKCRGRRRADSPRAPGLIVRRRSRPALSNDALLWINWARPIGARCSATLAPDLVPAWVAPVDHDLPVSPDVQHGCDEPRRRAALRTGWAGLRAAGWKLRCFVLLGHDGPGVGDRFL